MGLKKKWTDGAVERKEEFLLKLNLILSPEMKPNRILDPIVISGLDEFLPSLLAFILNCELLIPEDKELRNFGADYIVPIKIRSDENNVISIWGKIHWLSIANTHKTYRNNLKDPFFCKLVLNEDENEIVQLLFGDYNCVDIEFDSWIDQKIAWIYEL